MLKRTREDDSSESDDGDITDERFEASTKFVHLDGETDTPAKSVITCSLAPHINAISFPTYEAFEVHYKQNHVNRCSECDKNLPTEHLLLLHIAENHDPLNEAKKARGEKIVSLILLLEGGANIPKYACFVEGCDKICVDPIKRRMHLVDKHHFPKNYDFFVVNNGMDQRCSMLRSAGKGWPRTTPLTGLLGQETQQHASTSATSEPRAISGSTGLASNNKDSIQGSDTSLEDSHCGTTDAENELAGMTKSMSALKFTPSSIRFGRGGAGGFARK